MFSHHEPRVPEEGIPHVAREHSRLHLPPHRMVSIALAAKALGARQIDRSFSVKSLSVKSLYPRWLILQTQQQGPATQVAAMSAKTASTTAPQHRPSSSLGNPAANPAASLSSTDDTKHQDRVVSY